MLGSFVSIGTDELGDLIEVAQGQLSDDTPEMNEIVRRFDGLAVAVATVMTPDAHLRKDLANAGRMAIVAAVRHHQLGHPGFPAYVKVYVTGAAKRELNRWTRTALPNEFERVDVNDEAQSRGLYKVAESLPPAVDRTWGSMSTGAVVLHLDVRQQDLLQLRFMEDCTLATIAKFEGTSQSAVSQRLTTALRVVERYLVA